MSYQGGHVHLRSERPYLRNLDPAQYMCHDPERGVHVIRLFDDCTHMHTRCEVCLRAIESDDPCMHMYYLLFHSRSLARELRT